MSIVRSHPTGSVVMHSSLSLIQLVLAWPVRTPLAPAHAATGRHVAVHGVPHRHPHGRPHPGVLRPVPPSSPVAAWRRSPPVGLGLAITFSLWTTLVSDSFYLRLIGAQGDYSSGRWASIGHWLSLAGDHPWGLGLGAVRELLAGGRPALDGTALLEWPHNELVRFYVEAGPPGLLFVVLLLAVAVRRAVRVTRENIDPVQRTLALAIAADLVAEAFLQNLLNAVYHATVLFLLLTLATSPERADASAMPLAEPAPGR